MRSATIMLRVIMAFCLVQTAFFFYLTDIAPALQRHQETSR